MPSDADADAESIAVSLLADHLPGGAPDHAAATLASFARMVADWGSRMNLTGHESPAAICRALIGDAIGVLAAIEDATGHRVTGRVIDLGSGAGFPGMPIAIVRPEADVVLVEIREKRHLFQRAVRRQLGIHNVTPVRARIEACETEPGDLVLAQAVGPIGEVVRAIRPYLHPGSVAVIPGGLDLASPPDAGDLSPAIIEYRSPLIDQPRRLWLGRARG